MKALCRFNVYHDFVAGGRRRWTEDVLSGAFNGEEVFCDCSGGGNLLDIHHIPLHKHTERKEVASSTWSVSRILLVGVLTRLAAVRLDRLKQADADWLVSARPWAQPLAVLLNALTPSAELLQFC